MWRFLFLWNLDGHCVITEEDDRQNRGSGRAAAFSAQRPMNFQNSEYLPKVNLLGMVNMKSGSLTPNGLHFLCLNPWDILAILLCQTETVDARPTYIGLQDTTIGCSKLLTAVVISDLIS